jgi:ADP-heptose:LPS heptosyltransferase
VNGLLDSIRRVRTTFRGPTPEADAGPPIALAGQRVLVVYLFDAVGDAILLGPALAALLDAGAKAPLGVLVRPNAARVLRLLDLPLKLHVLPDALQLPPVTPGRPETAKAWRAPEVKAAQDELTAALAARKYDVAVDLTFRADTDARRWLAASGAAVRLGWLGAGEDPKAAGLSSGAEDIRVMADRHWSRYLTLPLARLGVRAPRFELGFKLPEGAKASAEAHFKGPRPWVVLVPGARNPAKRWDPERFERVGQWVVREAQGSVVVAGAPSEAKLVKGLTQAIGGPAQGYTKKDLATLVALLQAADAVLTNDTGPMHLAFLSKAPTVAIFTWMNPLCWGPPVTDPRFVVLRIPSGAADDAEGIYTRAAIHYLDALLGKFGRVGGRS